MENQTVQNPTPEPTLAPVQVSEPKAKFPVMYLVLSLLILVFLVSTAFLYYQNMQLKNILASYRIQPVASPAPTTYQSPVPTTDPTANWKTFIQKGVIPISFKYPSNLVVSVRSGERPVIVIDTKQSVIPEMFDSPIAPIEIMLDLNSNTYSKAVENAKSAFDTSSLKVDVLNNNGVTGSLITGNVIPGMRSGRFVEAYFDNGTNPAIVFWYEGYSETYKNTTIGEEVFTQIVKTVSLVK